MATRSTRIVERIFQLFVARIVPVTAYVSNKDHIELRAGEEFLGNETEESFLQMLKEGLQVRMGMQAFGKDGKPLQMNLRPIFIVADCILPHIVISPVRRSA